MLEYNLSILLCNQTRFELCDDLDTVYDAKLVVLSFPYFVSKISLVALS